MYKMKKNAGLSRIEVISVMVCIFLALSVFHATANMSRENAKRQMCANNIRINTTAIVRYAQAHENATPLVDSYWLHDIYVDQVNLLIDEGATSYTFFCPSDQGYNTYKMPDSMYWTNLSPLVVSSYFWMTQDKYQSPRGSGDKQWVKTIDVEHPETTELVTDAQFSDGTMTGSNYAFVKYGVNGVDYTNHLQGAQGCAGGNIGFVDTHVQWRPFDQMEYRWMQTPYHWW